MSLEVINSPDRLAERMRAAIAEALPGAEVRVRPGAGPGHFEVEVVSAAFAGLSRVQQQQRVYAALRPFMSGEGAPVHAIDRMMTATPEGAGR